MPILIPNAEGQIIFSAYCNDEDGNTLTLVSATLLAIDSGALMENPEWFDNGVTSSGYALPDGRYQLRVDFLFTVANVPAGLYLIELVATDGTFEVATEFTLDVQDTAYTPMPTDIDGLVGWYRADGLVGYSDGDPISEVVNDAPGNVLGNLTQSETDKKPAYVLYDEELGGPAINFDSSNDELQTPSSLDLSKGRTTIFVVAKLNDLDGGTRHIWLGDQAGLSFDNNGDRMTMTQDRAGSGAAEQQATNMWAKGGGYNIYTIRPAANSSSSNPANFMQTFFNGVIALYKNFVGNLDGTDGTPERFGLALGGRIAEIICYEPRLNDYNRGLVEIYLAQKYNMAIGPNGNLDPAAFDGMYAWYKAEDYSGGTLPDASGNGRDLSGTATKLTDTAHGLPSLRFNGTSDYLQGSSGFSPVIPATSTIIIVARGDVITENSYFLIDGVAEGFRQAIYLEEPQTISIYQGSSVSGSRDTTDYTVITAVFDSTDELWVNNKFVTSGNAGGNTMTGITLGADHTGASSFLEGEICEVMVFDRPLTLGERNHWNSYMAWRYGIDFFELSPNP